MTRAVDAVLFDVGGVFLVPDRDKLQAVLEPFGGSLNPEQAFRAHYAGTAAMDAGRAPNWLAYRETTVRAAAVPAERFAAAVGALEEHFFTAAVWSTVVPGTVDALRALADDGYAVGIVSNADGTIEEMLVRHAVCQVGEGNGVPVAVVVDSTVVGIDKPDPAIFHLALERLGVAAERTVFVGDTAYADVDGALAAGIHPLHLDPFGDCPYPRGSHQHVRALEEIAAAVEGLDARKPAAAGGAQP